MSPAALSLMLLLGGSSQPFMKGMTVSCPGYGRIWGTEAMVSAAKRLKATGVDWIAIHPYGGVRRDGSIRFEDPAQTDYMILGVSISRREGHQVFWKPHLAYWGSFEWRGAIEFEGEKAWKRFFADYEKYIVAHARFAQARDIPVLSVGLEYEKTMHREADWRRIIKAVRRVYRGKLTYAANWDGVHRVPFWDALDYIGVQAYFPLSLAKQPTDQELTKAWAGFISDLGGLSKKYGGKKVLLTEIGYARSKDAAREPWKPKMDDAGINLRKRLVKLAFEKMRHPLIVGAFWWKWIPGRNAWDRDFSMRDPEVLQLMERHWR